jgi:hypothetical protein
MKVPPRISFPPKTTFAPTNACIYCGARGPGIKLTDEHIVPLSLGGTYVLPKASCLECADKTKNLEGYAARQVFQDVRVEYEFPTRRPSERPRHLPLRESFSPSPESAPIRLVPTQEYPGTLILIVFEPAGILEGRSPNEGAKGYPFIRFIGGRERGERLKEQGIDSKVYREFKADLFLRLIAKIALGFAVAAWSLDSFEPTVRDIILRRDTNLFYWVGGVTKEMMD